MFSLDAPNHNSSSKSRFTNFHSVQWAPKQRQTSKKKRTVQKEDRQRQLSARYQNTTTVLGTSFEIAACS